MKKLLLLLFLCLFSNAQLGLIEPHGVRSDVDEIDFSELEGKILGPNTQGEIPGMMATLTAESDEDLDQDGFFRVNKRTGNIVNVDSPLPAKAPLKVNIQPYLNLRIAYYNNGACIASRNNEYYAATKEDFYFTPKTDLRFLVAGVISCEYYFKFKTTGIIKPFTKEMSSQNYTPLNLYLYPTANSIRTLISKILAYSQSTTVLIPTKEMTEGINTIYISKFQLKPPRSFDTFLKPVQSSSPSPPSPPQKDDVEDPIIKIALEELNKIREGQGLKSVGLNQKLTNSAKDQSNYMAAQGVMDHRPDTFKRFTRYGIPKNTVKSENVAVNQNGVSKEKCYGYKDSIKVTDDRSSAVYTTACAWWQSEDHRVNMLSPDVAYVGIAYTKANWGGSPAYYWTQNFSGLV